MFDFYLTFLQPFRCINCNLSRGGGDNFFTCETFETTDYLSRKSKHACRATFLQQMFVTCKEDPRSY